MRWPNFCSLFALLILESGGATLIENDEHDETQVANPPRFISSSLNLTATVGDTTVLPCEAEIPEHVAVLWSLNGEYFFGGNITIHQDDKFQIVNGNSLQISDVVQSDSGRYTCQIGTEPSLELTHRLEVMYNCGGDIIAESGVIASRNYPGNYSPSEDCTWKITAPEHFEITLTFLSFDLEEHVICEHDFVEIRDGSPYAPVFGRYCGKYSPGVLRSTRNRMSIRFVTDSANESSGFWAKFETRICGDDTVAERGVISNREDYGYYLSNSVCIWKITVPENDTVVLQFNAFNVQPGENCSYDSVKVFDGHDPFDSALLGIFCGYRIPKNIHSTTNKLSVTFVTDGALEGTGFTAEFFKDTCGGDIAAVSGVISSPNFPGNYPRNSICTWNITVPEGNIVTLQFNAFSVEDTENCSYDSVKVFDGHDPIDIRVLGKFCGENIPDAINSTTNTMSVTLVSDRLHEGTGFTAEFFKVPVSYAGVEDFLRQLPNAILK